jgi:hypothetical protein
MKTINVILVILLAVIMTGCGSCEKFFDKQNYESITNESGNLTLWNGGQVMAVFPEMTIVYSAADSDALYFQDKKGSNITLRSTEGTLHKVEGKGEYWYNSPGVLINLGK